MSHKRFSKLLLVVLALAFWAGTANAQPAVSTPAASLTYVSGGGSNVTATTSTTSGTGTASTGDAYTIAVSNYTGGTPTGWLTATPGTNLIGDTITYGLDATNAATWPAGTYHATVTITDTTDSNATATAIATLVVTSPLTAAAPSSTNLTFVTGGGSSQPAASSTVVISSTDASYDAYTVVKSGTCPAFLVATSGGGSHQAKASTTDTLTMSINTAGSAAATSITTCTVQLQYNAVTFSIVTFTNVAVVAQPLLLTAPTYALTWNKAAQSGQQTTSVTVKSPPNTSPIPTFSLDLATLPPWLTVTSGLPSNSASASIIGDTVTFTLVTGVAGGMPTGNYSQMVGFYSGTYGDAYATISLQISNAVPSLTTAPIGTTSSPFNSSSPVPTPSVTIYSSDEPAPFIATCTVTLSPATYVPTNGYTQGCSLNGQAAFTQVNGLENVVNGTTFTWGYTINATLDPKYFQQAIGNVVTVTITFSGTATTAPSPVVYAYTLQPGTPTINPIGGAGSGLSPNSVAAKYPTTQDLVVLVQGTNFVTPGSIVGGVILPTQLWIGSV